MRKIWLARRRAPTASRGSGSHTAAAPQRPRRVLAGSRNAVLAGLLAFTSPLPAYGPAGHEIAGHAAEALLCEPARDRIAALAEGAGLAEIGRWADTVRSVPRYEQSLPWHYMNIADGASLETYEHPPERDVLWAIRHFRARLADRGRARAERLEALRFLTHFVVDIHQPLHVGREDDRGGNTIDVVLDGERMNLHRFWDSGVLDLDGGVEGYVERLLPVARRLDAEFGSEPPERWAEESLMYRPWVYGFDTGGGTALSTAYVERARALTQMRLAQAAVRLAATFESIYCP